MALQIRMAMEPIRTLGFGAMDVGYTGVGGVMAHPIRQFFLQNLTDTDLMFSLNGIDDNLLLPSSGYIVLDLTSNKTIDQGFFFGQNQRLYVRYLTDLGFNAPTEGAVWFSVIYGTE